jgi:hypothetical protein
MLTFVIAKIKTPGWCLNIVPQGRAGRVPLSLSPGRNGRLRAPRFQRQPGARSDSIDKTTVLRQIAAKDSFDTQQRFTRSGPSALFWTAC